MRGGFREDADAAELPAAAVVEREDLRQRDRGVSHRGVSYPANIGERLTVEPNRVACGTSSSRSTAVLRVGLGRWAAQRLRKQCVSSGYAVSAGGAVEGALPASTPRSHLPGAHAAMVAAEEPSAHEPAAAAHRCGRVGEELPAPQGISQPPVRRQVQPPEQTATQDEEPWPRLRAGREPPRRRPSTAAALSPICVPLTPDRTTGASCGSVRRRTAPVPLRCSSLSGRRLGPHTP